MPFYLKKLGHSVTVLTTKKQAFHGNLNLDFENNGFHVIETEIFSKRFLSFLSKRQDKSSSKSISNKASFILKLKETIRVLRKKFVGSLFDIHDYWGWASFETASQIVQDKNIQLVISSYSPPAVHRLASHLKKKYPHLFCVADYRDLWTDNDQYNVLFPLNLIEKWDENSAVKRADLLVSVSNGMVKQLSNKWRKKTLVISNGFFPTKGSTTISSIKHGFVYTGQIYPDRRDPSPLFQALSELIKEESEKYSHIKLEFYGYNVRETLKHIVKKYNLENNVILEGQVSYQESLEIQKSSQGLIFLESNNEKARGVLTGKIFEYLVAKRPIIAIGVKDDFEVAELITKTKTGLICGNNIEKIKETLVKFQNCSYEWRGDEKKIASYSRESLAEKLSLYCENLINRK